MAAVKAYLLTEGGDQIKCLFNPAELTISKSNSWQGGEAKGKNAPELRFQAGQPASAARVPVPVSTVAFIMLFIRATFSMVATRPRPDPDRSNSTSFSGVLMRWMTKGITA